MTATLIYTLVLAMIYVGRKASHKNITILGDE